MRGDTVAIEAARRPFAVDHIAVAQVHRAGDIAAPFGNQPHLETLRRRENLVGQPKEAQRLRWQAEAAARLQLQAVKSIDETFVAAFDHEIRMRAAAHFAPELAMAR